MKLSRRQKAHLRILRRRWRFIKLSLLRLSLRLAPSENQRVFALTIVVGAICGLAAVAFHLSIIKAEHLMIDRAMAAQGHSWVYWTILTPTLGGIFSGILLYYFIPAARGSGIPQVKVAYAVKGGRLSFREAMGKFAIGTLQIGSGASLGREGPTVHICAGIASTLGRGAALSPKSLKRLLPVGAAAGIAAAFNAPIAAVTFTIEEVVGDLDQTVLSGVVVAAALAAAIERSVLGEHPVFTISQMYGLDHASSLISYALLGVFAAFISIAFSESLLNLRRFFERLVLIPAWARPGIGGLVTGTLAVVAIATMGITGITGGGYETLSNALSGQLAFRVMLALCVMKLLATVFSYSSGGAGGIFAPALFIGGMLGGAVGYLDMKILHHSANEIGPFALVGMGAAFAGIIRAPITSVLIIFEMTGSYGLILPLMIANMISYGLARHLRPVPIYDALLEQDGIHLPHPTKQASHVLEQLRVQQAMTRDMISLQSNISAAGALELAQPHNHSIYPVIDPNNHCVGVVSDARLRRTVAEGKGDLPLIELMRPCHTVFPDNPLMRAVIRMNQQQVGILIVTDRSPQARAIGIVTLADVVNAQARAAMDSGLSDKSIVPGFADPSDYLPDHSGRN
jgi:CIC family chloride channel protein